MRFWHSVTFLEPEQMLDIARRCDELGYDGITISDHLFYPKDLRSKYPYSHDGTPTFVPGTPWLDPWAAICAMAAVTRDVRFMTNIYVAPARDVFTVAKVVSTAAVLSGDRVALGVGAGWMREEFEGTGQDFATRGKRLNEMIPALREIWQGGFREFHGQRVDVPPIQMSPGPSKPIPIYIGGETQAAFRRAARLGDGWIGNLYTPDVAEERVAEMHRHLKEAGRADEPFEIIVALLARPDADLYRRFEDLGVTGLLCAPWMLTEPKLDARLKAIEEFAGDILAKMH